MHLHFGCRESVGRDFCAHLGGDTLPEYPIGNANANAKVKNNGRHRTNSGRNSNDPSNDLWAVTLAVVVRCDEKAEH